jgi:Protein of unknown function (DUF1997)
MPAQFVASQSVELIVPEQSIPIQYYLRKPQRLVQALVDPSRLEQLGADTFRLSLRPLSFMHLSFQPVVDMKVWAADQGEICLQSIDCDIRGVDYINQRFALKLAGKLAPYQRGTTTYLKGNADLRVSVDLPAPLCFTPLPLLEAAGNGLLKSVLLTIKQRLMHQLLADYQAWVQSTQTDLTSVSTPLPNLSANSPLV